MPIIIAIDGPAGSGKGTLARKLASHLGYDRLDTGKLYRLLAFEMTKKNLLPARKEDMADEKTIDALLKGFDFSLLDNPALLTEEIAAGASLIATQPAIRTRLRALQRDFATNSKKGAVLEGRDIGTVICPKADYKFFLEASAEVRAQRRHKELLDLGQRSFYMKVLDEVQKRDKQDRSRKEAPLKPAEDAIIIDGSTLTAEQVFDTVLAFLIPEKTRIEKPALGETTGETTID